MTDAHAASRNTMHLQAHGHMIMIMIVAEDVD